MLHKPRKQRDSLTIGRAENHVSRKRCNSRYKDIKILFSYKK